MVADNDLATWPHRRSPIEERFCQNVNPGHRRTSAQDGLEITSTPTAPLPRPSVQHPRDASTKTHTTTNHDQDDTGIFDIPAKTRYLASARAMTSVFKRPIRTSSP